MIKKIKDLFWRIAIAYHEHKNKKFERHNCSMCGKRQLFDVPTDVPIEMVAFICAKCVELEQKSSPFEIHINLPNPEPITVTLFPKPEFDKVDLNAEDKAKQLVDYFRKYVKDEIDGDKDFHYSRDEETKNAKICAIFCIDQIMEGQRPVHEFRSNVDYDDTIYYQYWNEIKDEINKIS